MIRPHQVCAAALTVAGFAAFGADARAQSNDLGFYGAIGAGLNMPIDSNANSVNGGTSVPMNVRFRSGYNVIGAVGLKWASALRTEVEMAYRKADVHQLGNTPANGSQSILSFSGNVLFDFNMTVVTPYLGAGLGASHNDWTGVYAGAGTPNFDGSNTTLQYQFIGGVGTRFTETTYLFVEYRYIGAGTASFPSATADILQNHHDHSNNALAGLRFFF
jgi:opacity protein-like surface antigen